MSAFPLHELRSLLNPATPVAGLVVAGLVVAVRTAVVDIATPTGLRTARPAGRALALGERVTVRDGLAYPAAAAAMRYVL